VVELDSEDNAIGAYQKFCGPNAPPMWNSTAGRVQVKFRSNRVVNDVGFNLTFTAGRSIPPEYHVFVISEKNSYMVSDFEQPLIQFLRSRYSLTLNIS